MGKRKKTITSVIMAIVGILSFALMFHNDNAQATEQFPQTSFSSSSKDVSSNAKTETDTNTEYDELAELCDNYKEIKDFKNPIPIIWTAKFTGCLVSCQGAHFSRIPEEENYQYPRFAGYWNVNGGRISKDFLEERTSEDFLKDNLILKIYGKWIGIDADHPYSVFNSKCVPIIEIEKIGKL